MYLLLIPVFLFRIRENQAVKLDSKVVASEFLAFIEMLVGFRVQLLEGGTASALVDDGTYADGNPAAIHLRNMHGVKNRKELGHQ